MNSLFQLTFRHDRHDSLLSLDKSHLGQSDILIYAFRENVAEQYAKNRFVLSLFVTKLHNFKVSPKVVVPNS